MMGHQPAGRTPRVRLWGVDDDVRERAALWSAYYHRFAGAPRAAALVEGRQPLSPDAACGVLAEMPRERRAPIRRALAHLVTAGYRPGAHRRAAFDALARHVTDTAPGEPRHAAVAKLRAFGGRSTHARPFGSDAVAIDGRLYGLARGDCVPLPTTVTVEADGVSVRGETLVPRPLDAVAAIVRPQNWHRLGPFFESTSLVGPSELREVYVVDWDLVRFERFEVHLRVDFTRTRDRAHADYSLMYDRDRRLFVDDGWSEAQAIEGHPDWTRYIGVKKVKFAASYSNLLAPAMMSMFIESNADWLLKAIGP